MGQHLHLYASKSVTVEEAQAWCNCRIDEYHRTPEPGFEEDAERRVRLLMQSIHGGAHPDHWESGSTWAVQVWPKLWWNAYLITPKLIEEAVTAAATYDNPNRPGTVERWTNGSEIEFLRNHLGYTGWGDNDGI
jgi:hypothetical protein